MNRRPDATRLRFGLAPFARSAGSLACANTNLGSKDTRAWLPALRYRDETPRRSEDLYFRDFRVCSLPVPAKRGWSNYTELIALFFVHGMALGMWFVPLTTVLEANGLHAIRPYAFATSALAAFVSPLLFGAMADRHLGPVRVLRRIALGTAVAMAVVATSTNASTPRGAPAPRRSSP